MEPTQKSAQPLECTPRGRKSANTRPLTHIRDGKARTDPATNTDGHSTRLKGKAEGVAAFFAPMGRNALQVPMHLSYLK